MSFLARVNLEIEADSFSDLLQKLTTLSGSYVFDSVHIHPQVSSEGAGNIGGAILGGPNSPKPARVGNKNAAAGKVTASTEAAQTGTSPAAGAEAPSPAPAASPAPAPAPASAKSPAELVSELRAILTPVNNRDAAGKKQVAAFVSGRGYSNIVSIPAAELPGIIDAAKKEFQ